MLLKIEKYGSEKLREPAHKVAVTPELAVLAEDMLETMYKAKGVGLAAEQVGRTESLCVIDVPLSCEDDEETKMFNAGVAQPLIMFNPEILSFSGEQTGREGCLSLPNVGGDVTRPFEVTVQFLDIKGVPQIITVRGFLARAVCHETDHLKGTLYVDRMDEKSREKVIKKLLKNNSK
jgi:peptide deformylase